MKNRNLKTLLSTAALLAVAVTSTALLAADKQASINPNDLKTTTPIKHLVVIFNENRSFDHYFGTYPNALNPEGEPRFEPAKNTPAANNLLTSPALLDNNPNATNTLNGAGASNPFRLDRTQANTNDQNHAYTAEQKAFDGGKLDLFPLNTGAGTTGGAGAFGTTGQVMGFFDATRLPACGTTRRITR
jgi:phospholipase C